MGELIDGVNWLAVILGFFLSFLLGWLWFSPKLFGKKWALGVGVEMNEDTKPAPLSMALQASGTFMLAWLVGITAVSNALLTILLIMFAFICLQAANGLFCQKSKYAILVEAGYIFTMTLIMIVCQGVF
ncbi:twitching motility protein PilT [Marinomonas sp. SBI22]|uniref:DUF1761 domain-containing protein n=1 Tax=unclassified Marinomonas TaxID=196814 RepID=UPI0007AFD7DA|nr:MULTISPECIES: DUF1761 domain-containing protein [unclassified Marinomonas]KZM42417.1 twitching motility protein PilT [Marinomonas sp. SBI22]KZM43811.1 twitching motility protein PilT [Marinomonas sp. SBI8L]